jgi:hypothetical protein
VKESVARASTVAEMPVEDRSRWNGVSGNAPRKHVSTIAKMLGGQETEDLAVILREHADTPF